MPSRRTIAPSTAVLIAGCLLRLALAVIAPTRWAYDDHFEPIKFLLREHRLPLATDCWECYQPPLYYLVAAGPYAAVESATTRLSATTNPGRLAAAIAEKAVQLLSVLYGCATLWLSRRILRAALPLAVPATVPGIHVARASSARSPRHEALALSVIAFLPQHIYISAMATNDALTQFLATVAIYIAILAAARTGWREISCWVLVGVVCGLAVLTKAYGWVTPAAIAISLVSAARLSRARTTGALETSIASDLTRDIPNNPESTPATTPSFEPPNTTTRRALAHASIVLAVALAVAIWPNVRNLRQYGRAQVDNFDFFQTPMRFQPPGSFRDTEFLSFHPLALWEKPFLHTSHVRSFWTEMYARFWFDYEPIHTLSMYPPWLKLHGRAERAVPQWDQRRWNYILNYAPADVPMDMAWIGRISYLAALPLTLLLFAGLLASLRIGVSARTPESTAPIGDGMPSIAGANPIQATSAFAIALVASHLVLSLCIPVFQTLRLPHFSAMKAAFALGGLSSVPVLVALALAACRGRAGKCIFAVTCVAAFVIAAMDAAYALSLSRLVIGAAR